MEHGTEYSTSFHCLFSLLFPDDGNKLLCNFIVCQSLILETVNTTFQYRSV